MALDHGMVLLRALTILLILGLGLRYHNTIMDEVGNVERRLINLGIGHLTEQWVFNFLMGNDIGLGIILEILSLA